MAGVCIALCRLKSGARNPYSYNAAVIEDLGLGYLAAALGASGHDARILDAELMNWDDDVLLEKILWMKPFAVGFSLLGPEYERVLALARGLRAAFDRAPLIIVGDHLATLYQDILAREPLLDLVFAGEAERTLPRVLAGILAEGGETDERVQRIKEKSVAARPNEVVHDLDSLPFPDRSVLRSVLTHSNGHARAAGVKANILGSRGCPGNCTFCSIARYIRRSGIDAPWRGRCAESIRREMEGIARECGVRDFIFFDDNFVGPPTELNKKRLRHIADEIGSSPYPFQFSFSCRPDSFCTRDGELLADLRGAGLRVVFMGIEAGNDRQLSLFNKNIDLDLVVDTVALIESVGLTLSVGYIMYTPYSDIDQLAENATYLTRINQAHLVRNYSQRLVLYPGTPIEHRIREDHLLVENGTFDYDWRSNNDAVRDIADAMKTALDSIGWKIDHLIDGIEDIFDYKISRLHLSSRMKLEAAYRKRFNDMKMFIGKTLQEHFLGVLHGRVECEATMLGTDRLRGELKGAYEQFAAFDDEIRRSYLREVSNDDAK